MLSRLGALLAVLVLIAACGQDTDLGPDTDPDDTASASPVGDTTADGTASAGNPDDLSAFLWTLDDLPEGFEIDDEYSGSAGSTEEDDDFERVEGDAECAEYFGFSEDMSAPGDIAGLDEVGVEFSAGEFGPYLMHSIMSVPAAQIQLEFSDMDRTLARCDGEEFTITDADGFSMSMVISGVSFAEVGERTIAFTIAGEVPEVDMELDMVFVIVQIDDTMSSFASMALSSELLPDGGSELIPDAEFEALVRLAVERLEAAL